jgi:hypothetical protein
MSRASPPSCLRRTRPSRWRGSRRLSSPPRRWTPSSFLQTQSYCKRPTASSSAAPGSGRSYTVRHLRHLRRRRLCHHPRRLCRHPRQLRSRRLCHHPRRLCRHPRRLCRPRRRRLLWQSLALVVRWSHWLQGSACEALGTQWATPRTRPARSPTRQRFQSRSRPFRVKPTLSLPRVSTDACLTI